MGNEPQKNDYLLDYKSMVNIQFKYVTLDTTYEFNRSARQPFFARQPPCFYNWLRCSVCELLYACDPHRPPQAASVCRWKRSCSVLFGHLIHDSHSWFWAGSISC